MAKIKLLQGEPLLLPLYLTEAEIGFTLSKGGFLWVRGCCYSDACIVSYSFNYTKPHANCMNTSTDNLSISAGIYKVYAAGSVLGVVSLTAVLEIHSN